jgi:hypothetical protein
MTHILRNRQVPDDVRALFPTKPRFASAAAEQLRNVRVAIQHMDEKVLNGTIPDGTPFALMATGDETPVPDQPGQTLKVIDRLVIGDQELSFVELAAWLTEMGDCAEIISKYERPKS